MAFYTQPLSRGEGGDGVLGAKCFAYSTLNALRQRGVNLPDITTQQDANDWVRAHFTFQDGGGSAAVLRELFPDRENNPFYYPELCSSGFIARAATAQTANSPVIIGVEVGATKLKHWIYMTGMGVGNTSILGEDQQNTGRGTLTFTRDATDSKIKATAGTTVYVITKMEVFLYHAAQPKSKATSASAKKPQPPKKSTPPKGGSEGTMPRRTGIKA